MLCCCRCRCEVCKTRQVGAACKDGSKQQRVAGRAEELQPVALIYSNRPWSCNHFVSRQAALLFASGWQQPAQLAPQLTCAEGTISRANLFEAPLGSAPQVSRLEVRVMLLA
jgi:hypothetical protein